MQGCSIINEMKKLFAILFSILLFGFTTHLAMAQDIPLIATPTSQIINTSYDLPYPGILPDSPLYFLKALRDNIIGFMISDPIKKSDYDLLMADKRLVSAESLIAKGNNDLAITTLSKSGNYFDQALQQVVVAKRQGEDFAPLVSKLIVAAKKHQAVIYQMEQKTKGKTRYELEFLLIRTKGFQETAELILSN